MSLQKRFICNRSAFLCLLMQLAIALLPAQEKEVSVKPYIASGTASTEDEAREDAVGSLATMMYMRVAQRSVGVQEMREKNGKLKKNEKVLQKSVTVTTDVPLLGVTYKSVKSKDGKQFEVEATLD